MRHDVPQKVALAAVALALVAARLVEVAWRW
jgi:hypothetical protein